MKFLYGSNKQPVMLQLTVATQAPQKMRLRVYDSKKPNTFYTDRDHILNGKKNFYVRMPISPEISVVEIFNERNGDLKAGADKSFQLLGRQALPLPTKIEGLANMNKNVGSAIKFFQDFAERAGYLSTGTYYSDDGKFRIDYVDIIRDENGRAQRTPSRVHTETGVIQVSAHHFRRYTVPKRIAILFHEYSHFYENTNQRDEVEADLNALLIYLGLGYPRIEAHQAFLDVFKNSPSDMNRKRYDILNKFIQSFDDINFNLQPSDNVLRPLK